MELVFMQRNTFLNITHTTIKNNNATNENGDPGSGGGIYHK